MKSSPLFIAAAIALLGAVACDKTEVPAAAPEEAEAQEAVIPEAAEPEQTLDINAVARILNEAAENEYVVYRIKNFLIGLREGMDCRHIEFSISKVEEEQEDPINYVVGSVGIVNGEFHSNVLDLDLMILDMVPLVGTLDLIQVSVNYGKAILAKDVPTTEEYLALASAGLDLNVMGIYRMCFLCQVDEEGHRIFDLYLINPLDPESEPVSLSNLLKLLLM